MPNSLLINLSELEISDNPYHHFSVKNIFEQLHANDILSWLEGGLNWEYTETDFYTQYEFSLKDILIPDHLTFLNSKETLGYIKRRFSEVFDVPNLELVDVTIHKLVDGHKMGVHNDFIGKEESHRLVIQLNEGWNEENGGYLMLFYSRDPRDVAKLVLPLHNSAIGFEISSQSFHAVSRVSNFTRYTLVYTFKNLDDSATN